MFSDVLIRSVAKFSKCILILFFAISFEVELALNWLCDTHRAGDVKTKNDRNILTLHLFVLDLSGSFNQVGYRFGLGLFLLVHNHDWIRGVAELTVPNLLIPNNGDNRLVIHYGLAALTELSVTSSDLSFGVETVQRKLVDVRVDFNVVLGRL